MDEVEKALLRVAMTKEQEEYMSAIVANGVEEIINVQSADAELQNKLTAIVQELKGQAAG